MVDMGLRSFRHSAFVVAVLTLVAALSLSAQDSHRGRKYKAPPQTSRVDVTILRKSDGKPVENAAVVFQMVGDKGNMELKTNEDGKTMIDVLPTGSSVLVQVIAKGFQTYGGEYTLDKPQMSIEVKLRRPGQQYSTYEQHPQEAEAQPSDGKKDSESKPDASQPQPQ